MKKTIFTLMLTSGLMVCNAFAEEYYVLDYSMLTSYMNYNPKYDYYPGLMAKQSQGNTQTGLGSISSGASSQVAGLQAQLTQLKQQRDNLTRRLSSASLSEMMALTVQGNQLNTEIQNLEDRLTALTTGSAPVRVVNKTVVQQQSQLPTIRQPVSCTSTMTGFSCY
jgi:peptidoglycan hydrolase CwlO-like protein